MTVHLTTMQNYEGLWKSDIQPVLTFMSHKPSVHGTTIWAFDKKTCFYDQLQHPAGTLSEFITFVVFQKIMPMWFA